MTAFADEAGDGTWKNPFLVQQWHYQRCSHVSLIPHPLPDQAFRVVAFLDLADWCPTCKRAHPPRRRKL